MPWRSHTPLSVQWGTLACAIVLLLSAALAHAPRVAAAPAAPHSTRLLLQIQQEEQQREAYPSSTSTPTPGPSSAPAPPAAAQPQLLNFTSEFSDATGSAIGVVESVYANTLAVQFRFAACSGVQLHHHSNTEAMMAINGSVTVAIVTPTNSLVTYNLTAGQMAIIPSGYLHYYLNEQGCRAATAVATWAAGTRTTFTLPALAALPPAAYAAVLATSGPAPSFRPGFPVVRDPLCWQRCGLPPPPPPAPVAPDGR